MMKLFAIVQHAAKINYISQQEETSPETVKYLWTANIPAITRTFCKRQDFNQKSYT
jgi:hypothetical protein